MLLLIYFNRAVCYVVIMNIYIYIYNTFQKKIVPINAYSLEKEFIIVTCNRKR